MYEGGGTGSCQLFPYWGISGIALSTCQDGLLSLLQLKIKNSLSLQGLANIPAQSSLWARSACAAVLLLALLEQLQLLFLSVGCVQCLLLLILLLKILSVWSSNYVCT